MNSAPYKDTSENIPTDVDFSCVVSESGDVCWKLGVTSFKRLAAGLVEGSAYASVEVLPQNDSEYPYLHPDCDWKLFIIGEEPAWFTDMHREKVMTAFEEWKSKVYSLIDLELLLNITNPNDINAGEPTAEDISNLAKWANVYNYLTVSPRSSVRDTITSAVGPSISSDAWNFIYRMAYAKRLTAAAGSAEKQVSLIAALIGSAFTGITEWKHYVGAEKDYPFKSGAELVNHGYLVSCFKAWNLHSVATTEIVYTLPASALSTGRAFACVADESGKVYYKAGIDYCSDIIEHFGLDASKLVRINVTPKSYFERDSEVAMTILNEETPSWFTDAVKEAVMASYKSWHETILDRIDCEGLLSCLTDETVVGAHTPINDELIKALKSWVAVWNKERDADMAINSKVTAAGWKAVGATVWKAMDGQVLDNYKLKHRGCPGPTTCGVVEAYIGRRLDAAVDEFMGNTINDSYSSFIGSFIHGICPDKNGEYMYKDSTYLWNNGCIPMYDGSAWYLLSGPDEDIKVIYSATNEELLEN